MGQERSSTLDERSVLWVYIRAPGAISAPYWDFWPLGFHRGPVLGAGRRCGHPFPYLIAIRSRAQRRGVSNSRLELWMDL
ncbi:unnamed protein product [Pleuronectes platessa]|uniref:Uncharacterized protein n=1 Tax=Pleuronectes platessa TaxID=8262 RepID=A0A9N7W072_PLEPL|nr:unnamed protein product [Pleuronectes platessa]